MVFKFKLLIFVAFLLGFCDVDAQHKIGLKFNAGVSKFFRDYTYPLQNNFSISSKLEPSISAGAFYEYSFNDKSFLTAELLYTLINSHEDFESTRYDQNQDPIGNEYSTITLSISYISLPILYGYRLGNFSFLAGMQVSQMVGDGSGTHEGKRIENGIETYSWSFELAPLPIEGFDYGLKVGLFYDINENISIETNYYYGLNNLAPSESTVFKIRQMVLGIRYKIYNTR